MDLKIALDWTPNINHIGIFVANELGYYENEDIQLKILNPLEDNYKVTPGKKLELGTVDFAITPFESVISLNNKKNIVPAIAVFAILQEDISSIASLKSLNLTSPKALDGRTYASYKARYEDLIVKEIVKSDGGKGDIKLIYPEKLGIWNTLLEGKADATWIFNNWEGVEAEQKHVPLNKFSMRDYGIPYCYSPVIIANNNLLQKNKTQYSQFIKATKKGYLYASEHKENATAILSKYLTSYDKAHIDVLRAINITSSYFGDETTCGFMSSNRVEVFLKWLVAHKLEDKKILDQKLFTNSLLV
ncbi:ABC transporter substrate-binding protein [Jejuia pallidilutea]|uniref:Thiamine pyrimidine synthase n=1 Tax=Jejuia pallidilutea TaxID=504487 RepID=A0A090WYY5_9FLAO|nr:ABC transporter substrate-binding protein [Jejuia pallidilutea]GAL68625.1 hydroxymethylpyrimidine ABC transporter substrate-binding component [Jejuia pallidilutea]GAL72567.1 hydroxymethylpyrimidine ABC transporter substrate-binding component [Jejuia pallidilutea]GAL90208.1 hydroxymethylpyrimidine ABC transporter substrate-binding component [Jejuia pallidilutea]